MRRFFTRLWNKMNEPHVEKVLMVLLPVLTLVLVSLILAPGILALVGSPSLLRPAPPAVSTAPEAEQALPSPSPEPALVPTAAPSFSPVPVSDPDDLSGWQEIAGQTYYYDRNGTPLTGLSFVEGSLYFFDQYGVKADALGIDVSVYNKFINWPAVAAQGIDYAVLRAGSRGWETGRIYEDSWFQRNLAEARAAGVDLGVYFYSTAIDPAEAAEEARYVLDCLKGAPLELPIFIDVEYSGDYPKGRADKLSSAQRELIINSFCTTVMDSGYKVGVYSGQNYFKYNLNFNSLDKYTIWLASYTRAARLPSFPGRYDMWQFTDSGTVNGIHGIVDMNASYYR